MEFLSIREFTTATRETQETLAREGKIVLTNHGKPTALVFNLVGENFEETLEIVRKVEHAQYVSKKLAEAEEYAKRPDAVWYDRDEFFDKARKELL